MADEKYKGQGDSINKEWDKNIGDKKKPFKGIARAFDPNFDLKDTSADVNKDFKSSGRHESSQTNVQEDYKNDINYEEQSPNVNEFDNKGSGYEEQSPSVRDFDNEGNKESPVEVNQFSETEEKPTEEVTDFSSTDNKEEQSVDIDNQSNISGRHDESGVEVNEPEERFNEESDVEVKSFNNTDNKIDFSPSIDSAFTSDDKKESSSPEVDNFSATSEKEGTTVQNEFSPSGRHQSSDTEISNFETNTNYEDQSVDVDYKKSELSVEDQSVDTTGFTSTGRHEESNVGLNKELRHTYERTGTEVERFGNAERLAISREGSDVEIGRFEAESIAENQNVINVKDSEDTDLTEQDANTIAISKFQPTDITEALSDADNDSPRFDSDTEQQEEDSPEVGYTPINLVSDVYNDSDVNIEFARQGEKQIVNVYSDSRQDQEFGSSRQKDIIEIFNSNEDEIYNNLNFKTTGTGFTQFMNASFVPEIEIKPNDPKLKRHLTKYDTRAVPLGSAGRDAQRMSSFLASPQGALFLGKQAAMQSMNPMRETRTLNVGWLSSVVLPDSGIFETLKTSIGLQGTRHGKSPLSFQKAPTYEARFSTGKDEGSENIWQVPHSTQDRLTGLQAARAKIQEIRRNLKKTDPDRYSSNFLLGGTKKLQQDAKQIPSKFATSVILPKGPIQTLGDDESFYYNKYHVGLPYEQGINRGSARQEDEDNVSTINNSEQRVREEQSERNVVTTISDRYRNIMSKRVYGNEDGSGEVDEPINFKKNIKEDYNTSAKNYKEISEVSREFAKGKKRNGYFQVSGSLFETYGMSNAGSKNEEQLYDDAINMLPVLDEEEGSSDVYNTENIASNNENLSSENLNLKDNKVEDLIPFKFFDVNNKKYVIFRATLTGLSEDMSPEWDSQDYIGRPDKFYIYNGNSRTISFDFKVYPNSYKEMKPMWSKINYLSSLNYPDIRDDDVFYYRAPFLRLTIGDMYREMFGFMNSFSLSIPEESTWELGDVMGNDDVDDWPKLPRFLELSIGYQVIEHEFPEIGSRMYDIPSEWRNY